MSLTVAEDQRITEAERSPPEPPCKRQIREQRRAGWDVAATHRCVRRWCALGMIPDPLAERRRRPSTRRPFQLTEMSTDGRYADTVASTSWIW